jgi:hypothetical protein
MYLSPLAGRGRIAVAIRVRGAIRESALVESPPHPDPLPASGEREQGSSAVVRGEITHQPATSLIRAINSSAALSTGTFSLTTRFIALAQAFSLFRMVNL